MNARDRLQNQSGSRGQGLASPVSSKETTPIVQIDPAASAALALAIRSARQNLKPARAVSSRSRVLEAAAILGLIGVGWLASYMVTLANQEAIQQLEAETARSQAILGQLSGDLDSLKNAIAAFKDVEQTSSVTSGADQGKLAEKVERLAIAVQEPDKKFTTLETRIERMESQILANFAAKASAPAPATAETAHNEAPAIKSARNEPLEGWTLREVYDGAALIEGQNRRLYEVIAGGVVPGIGRVEAIERRGRSWVVVTDKGFIGSSR